MILLLVIILCIPAGPNLAQASNHPGLVDYQGLDLFWDIINQLALDKKPTTAEWDRLFKSPAYSYLATESSKEEIISRFRVAYMPSLEEERKEEISKGNYNSMIIEHLVEVNHNRQRILQFSDSLKQQNILDNALKETRRYLPEKFVEEHQSLYPPVAFAIFEPDGKANGEIIVVDMAFAQNINLNLFLAHEAHHFFMAMIRKELKPATDENEEFILRSIKQLQLEGIADLIDKQDILQLPDTLKEEDNWYGYHYKIYYAEAKSTLSRVDNLLSQYYSAEIPDPETGRLIWNSFHFGTHPEALHMALLIENTFGPDQILTLLENPFDFFRSYQQAALKHSEKGWVFSEESLKYIQLLEDKYLVQKE